MQSTTSAFVGSIPENYDTHMGPMFFRPYGIDMAARVARFAPTRLLEVACGTGIATEELAKIPGLSIVASDLNPAMLDRAQMVRPDLAVEWKQADALALPFEDNSFDAVAIQFGVMFFPDKQLGINEAFRVLRPGGKLIFNVWESVAKNDVSRKAGEGFAEIAQSEPPQFLQTPFGHYDPLVWLSRLTEAGFEADQPEWVPRDCISESALGAAKGLVEGSPMLAEIQERGLEAAAITRRVAELLCSEYGDHPMRAKMEAIIFLATKPT